MSFVMAVRGVVASGLLVLSALASAPASAATLTTFEFNGNCTDCLLALNPEVNQLTVQSAITLATYPVRAFLTLSDYEPGSEIQDSQFVSFAYGGSNLLAPYSVYAPNGVGNTQHAYDFESIRGMIRPLQDFDFVQLQFEGGGYFTMFEDGGNWETCAAHATLANCNVSAADFGTDGRFTILAPPPTGVPAPGTGALLLSAMAALGLMGRRR